MTDIKPPYYTTPEDDIIFNNYRDFNREICKPGEHEDWPDGAIGVRVDENFWAVAALPFAEYHDKTIQEIVAELWPGLTEHVTFNPDSHAYNEARETEND